MSLTGTTGKYQDEVPALPKLPLNRYERIFKVYTEGKDGKQFYFYNILNRMEFPTNIDSGLIDTHIVTARQALTITSYDIYGDIFSWWIIYLLNKDVIGNSFFAKGGQQLKYILPSKRGLIYQQMTDATIFNNKHF
jgi:nucleoid-associated protein YgaU